MEGFYAPGRHDPAREIGNYFLVIGNNFSYIISMKSTSSLFPSAPPSRHTSGEETRARLIAAATEVFIAEGFRAARVQDIAQRAGLRLSAINYHFTSKEGLYLAVMHQHAEAALAAAPLTPPAPDLPLRERFGFAVRALSSRLLAAHGGTRIGELMVRELVNPTPVLDVLIENFMAPQSALFLGLIREVVGPQVPEETLRRCLISVFGQCVVYLTGAPMIRHVAPAILDAGDLSTDAAKHVATFSWAGLQAIREEWEGSREHT